jgi:formate hydrogenlyase transcriptional activator
MPEQAALDSAHLSRYDALLRTSKTLATHRTIGELFHVLGDELHPIIPFDYLALLLHDGLRAELRLVVLEPADLAVPFESKPLAEHGPAAMVWETQLAAVVPIPETGPVHPALAFLKEHGWKMTCCLPLTTAHRRIGVLVFGSRSASAYSTDVVAFMGQVAAIVAIAVENGINREHRNASRASFMKSGTASSSCSTSTTCCSHSPITARCWKRSATRCSASRRRIRSAWRSTIRTLTSSGSI